MSINTEETGTLRGHITVKGPTGEAVISVDAEVTAAHQSDASAHDEVVTPEPRVTSESPRSDRSGHDAQHQPGRDLTALTAGILPILAAGLLIVQSFSYNLAWTEYVITIAVLAFVAGGCMLLPRTRQSIGPGILLGAVAASTWGLMFFAGELTLRYIDLFGVWYWAGLVGHLILVLAAWLARLVLIRDPSTHFAPRWPGDARARVVIILGCVSAVPFIVLYINDSSFFDFNLSFLVAAVMAFVMPACAVIAAPRRFGISLLAGWIGGGSAIFLFLYTSRNNVTSALAVVFGCTLVLLAIAAGPLSRTKVPV